MAKTTALRQEQYRDRITATHKRIELIVELETFEKLAQLVKTSGCKSRIAYITGLIGREYDAFQGTGSLLYNDPLPDNTIKPPQPLPGNERPEDPIILWRQEPHRCQSRTVRGERCRKHKNLLVIPYRHEGKLYELAACKQHNTEFFTPYRGIFRLEK